MIPPHMLRELRYLEISTAKAVRNVRIGPHTSRSRGSGFDFDQHLAYRPGDDVRRIDWNATARLNTPYVRQTHAERELDVVMALDLSQSMAIGSSRYSKKEVTTFVAASILFSAASDQINAGFLTFSDRVLRWAPPLATRRLEQPRARAWASSAAPRWAAATPTPTFSPCSGVTTSATCSACTPRATRFPSHVVRCRTRRTEYRPRHRRRLRRR